MKNWKGPRSRYVPPWYGVDIQRARFEMGVKKHFPTLKGFTRTTGPKAGRIYGVTIKIPHYEPRQVRIFFAKCTPTAPSITANGPTDSPHRFVENALCIWYPKDPDQQRWVFADGLLMLLGMIGAHLFREAWWRETGEWLGQEVGHSDQTTQDEANAA